MALTRSFKDTVRARAQLDPEFRDALLLEAVNEIVSGDVATGRNILKKYINATIGYPMLAKLMDKNEKSIIRMLGPSGNPTASNLFNIIHQAKKQDGLEFEVHLKRA